MTPRRLGLWSAVALVLALSYLTACGKPKCYEVVGVRREAALVFDSCRGNLFELPIPPVRPTMPEAGTVPDDKKTGV